MKVWRICKRKYTSTAYDGIGAKKAGGRWNSRGNAVVYCSESLALAALEVLVHLNIEEAPSDLVAIPARIPEDAESRSYDVDDLPEDWRRVTGHQKLARRGDEWKNSRDELMLKVPSVVIPEETNLLLDPDHHEFSAIEIGEPHPFSFDDRLFVT